MYFFPQSCFPQIELSANQSITTILNTEFIISLLFTLFCCWFDFITHIWMTMYLCMILLVLDLYKKAPYCTQSIVALTSFLLLKLKMHLPIRTIRLLVYYGRLATCAYRHASFYCVSLYCTWQIWCIPHPTPPPKQKALCWSGATIGVIFLTFAHFASLCHISVILPILQTFTLIYLLW